MSSSEWSPSLLFTWERIWGGDISGWLGNYCTPVCYYDRCYLEAWKILVGVKVPSDKQSGLR